MVASNDEGANIKMITKDMNIVDLVEKYPAAAPLLMQSGMG